MPLLLCCEELQKGMRLAEAFIWRGRMMLPGGKILTESDVDILRRKYPHVSLRVGDPVLDSLAEFEDDSREREVAEQVTGRISQCMGQVHERFASRASMGGLDFHAVKVAAMEVMEYLQSHPVSAALLNRSLHGDSYLPDHAGNVFYLCMVLGGAVRDYVVRERSRQTAAADLSSAVSMDLLPLGLGAMFMDLGMYSLQHLVGQDGPLSDSERALVREHPVSGADMLPESIPAAARMVVRTHHENFDGSGYPYSLPGPSLHIFTRIARICDAYDAATAGHIYRQAKSPARALWEISSGPYQRFYDPVLSKVLSSLIQPFPIGAKLLLRDGRQAVVVRYNRKCPFQPYGIIAFDRQGLRLPTGELVGPVMLGQGDLCLDSFAGEDLSFLYRSELPEELAVQVEGTFFSTVFP